MPNLVGIGNSQVPTNAMLGGLAYQDSVGEIDIEKIKARTSDTAVDIFVYDTRKDSDGGAWRHRTQNTSWYNEGVSELRGARKEFPAVAVLVLEHLKLTIYDGDDPNLPMWMIVPTIANQQNMIAGFNDHDLITVAALNGIIVVGMSPSWNHGNIVKVNFIKDDAVAIAHNNDKKWTGGIINRNTDEYWQDITSGNYILTNHVNDVAMTVLPNAPIDDVTGLPIPTIAVATSGGFTVIKDDGTVANKQTTGAQAHQVAWLGSMLVGTAPLYYGIFDDPLVHVGSDIGYVSGGAESNYYHGPGNWKNTPSPIGDLSTTSQIITTDNKTIVATTTVGLNVHQISDSSIVDNNDGLAAYITSKYNTGWQVGDIKGAFLSDTDATDVTGSELITNGTFAANSNWTFQGAGTGWSISSGKLNYDGSGLIYHKAYQNITGLTVGQTYVLSIDVISLSSHNISFAFATTNIGSTLSANTVSTTGTHSITYTATQANISVYVQTNHATMTFSVDNFSLRIAEEDRSVNDNGLQVFGTVTKSAVATGAELVAYSGFSSSNYFKQSGSDKILFGTGDFSIIFWTKYSTGNNNQSFIDISSSAGGVGDPRCRIHQFHTPSGSIRFYTTGGNVVSTSNKIDAGWTCVVAVRRSSGLEIYINGELENSGNNSTTNFNSSAGQMVIGMDGDGSDPLSTGSMALVRVSLTAPSPEQIKKIYNDEKCLFHENAKCTLIGTSNAVNAIAHDDTTKILHVGTGSGRSDFRALSRINNTTTAVTTAISASNEFVAEQ